MGRWRRKNQYYKKGKKKKNGQVSQGKKENFSQVDIELLRQYLVDYRNGCERVCYAKNVGVTADDVTVATRNHKHSPRKHTTEEEDDYNDDNDNDDEDDDDNDNDDETVTIGGQEFRALTDELLGQPYMELPRTLNGKHRKCVHQLCVDIDLYHSGVGDRRDFRYVVVSIHSDGFRYVQELSPPPADVPLHRCRPWFCRIDSPVQERTQKAKTILEGLVDQPGRCLRDGLDFVDFVQEKDTDLSGVKPPSVSDQNWLLVNTPEKMQQCAKELMMARPTEIAFDMEMYNASKYTQATCLLQIASSAGKEYVIDTLAEGVWDLVSLLGPLFSDPTIVKVGHSIGSMDVRSLHRDFGIFVVNAFDTYEAAKVLCKHHGLAAVCQHYGLENSDTYTKLKEEYQVTDWRRRPLTEPMIRYGRYDVHYLLLLRRLMMRDLTNHELNHHHHHNNNNNTQQLKQEEGRMIASALAATLQENNNDVLTNGDTNHQEEDDDDEGYYTPEEDSEPKVPTTRAEAKDLRMQADLMRIITISQQRCLGLWSSRTESLTKNEQFLSLMKRTQEGTIIWKPSQTQLLEDLVVWRDKVAKQEECLPGMVCSLDLLVTIASKRPSTEATVRRIRYFLPQLLEESQKNNHLQSLLSLVRASLAKDGIPFKNTPRNYQVPEKKQPASFSSSKWALGILAVVAVGVTTAAVITLVRSNRQKR